MLLMFWFCMLFGTLLFGKSYIGSMLCNLYFIIDQVSGLRLPLHNGLKLNEFFRSVINCFLLFCASR